MGLAVFIIIIQFGVIGWLAYPRLKPNAEKYWNRAEEMVKRLNRTDSENWVEDFNRLQGVEPKKVEPPKPSHHITHKWSAVSFGIEQINFKCSCGVARHAYSAYGFDREWENHLSLQRKLGS